MRKVEILPQTDFGGSKFPQNWGIREHLNRIICGNFYKSMPEAFLPRRSLVKGAVKYFLLRRTTADSAFLLARTNVHTESQPIGMQNQLLSFSLDNT